MHVAAQSCPIGGLKRKFGAYTSPCVLSNWPLQEKNSLAGLIFPPKQCVVASHTVGSSNWEMTRNVEPDARGGPIMPKRGPSKVLPDAHGGSQMPKRG